MSKDKLNGLRALELYVALKGLVNQVSQRTTAGSLTISTIGNRTGREQEIIGLSHIIYTMFPFAIEVALKSLKRNLSDQGTYDHRHELDDLFFSLTDDAKDINDAKKAQGEARDCWESLKGKGTKHDGTLDEFLKEHRKDFVDNRYYDWSKWEIHSKNFEACVLSVLAPLATRGAEFCTNLVSSRNYIQMVWTAR